LTLADWAVAGHLSFAEKVRLRVEEFPNLEKWRAGLDENEEWKASEPQV